MTIDWLAFLAVFAVALGAACIVVLCFSAGIRLLATPGRDVAASGKARDEEMDAVEHGARSPFATIAAIALFAASGVVVLYGVYLIVPALHP